MAPRRGGINSAGAEFASGTGRFDSDASFAFYADRGFDLVRIPFRWESAQPQLGAPLDPAFLARLQAAVASCTSRRMDCILDVHNYGRYGGEPVGGPAVSTAHLGDLWTRLAEVFRVDPRVELGLMNEPHDMPGGAVGWQAAAQEAVDAVRATGAENHVWVAGEAWSSAASYADTHPTWWVDDPLSRSGPEGHYYFDVANQRKGTYPNSFAVDDAAAVVQGFDSLRHKVEVELGSFVAYCRGQGVRGLVGEIGWPSSEESADHPADSPLWDAVGRTAYTALGAGGLDVAQWAAGEQWGSAYNLSVYTGTPQRRLTSVAEVIEPRR